MHAKKIQASKLLRDRRSCLHAGRAYSCCSGRRLWRASMAAAVASQAAVAEQPAFVFTEDNFRAPKLPANLKVVDVPLVEATDEALEGFGYVLHSADERTVEKKNFEIVQWPAKGWRKCDPGCGDEAGTTEGRFEVRWEGDFFYGKNLAVATTNNTYLDGLGALPEVASRSRHTRRPELQSTDQGLRRASD